MREQMQAYARVAQQTASPRELEAQLLLRAAARLQTAAENEAADQIETLAALRYNRRLWTVLLGAVTNNDNPLPQAVRQSIANLALFVLKHSLQLEGEPRREKFPLLVSINREIAAGLRGATPAPVQPAS